MIDDNLLAIPYDKNGIFIERPNRFVGIVEIKDDEGILSREKVHIHDPGRLKELLFDGNTVLLRRIFSTTRKTKWELIAAKFENNWILTNSAYHSKIAKNLFKLGKIESLGNIIDIKSEIRYGKSRLDFLLYNANNEKWWIEVKGCTLMKNGIALFPDAPTARGKRHLEELIDLKRKGENSAIIILIFQPNSVCFSPNFETDPNFSQTFFFAQEIGVKIIPVLLKYNGKAVKYERILNICSEIKK